MSAGLSSMKILWNPWVDKAESGKRKAEKIFQTGRGFSLIELLGVLAVMGILAAITVPPIIRQIQQARTTNEEANLEEVARAIVEGIKATGTIPNPNTNATTNGGWATIAGNYTALGTNQLLYAFGTNSATQRRVYLSDELMSYFTANLILPPFVTPPGGWPTNAFPANAQLVIVSSSREDFGLASPAAANVSSNDLNWLKSFTKTPDTNGLINATNVSIIGTIGTSTNVWTNQGQFLQIKTVDLRSLFCLVQLEDTRSPASVFTTFAGSNYSGYGPETINTSGVTLAVYFSGSTNTNTSISSVGIASVPGRILWADSGSTNPISLPLTNPITVTQGIISNGLVDLVFPATPSYATQTNTPSLMAKQDETFYVIKGTSLRLGDASLAPQKTVVIEGNSTFRFFNGAWTRVD